MGYCILFSGGASLFNHALLLPFRSLNKYKKIVMEI